jgi:predicted  nucleic acid-binding Zn-ribbon protein
VETARARRNTRLRPHWANSDRDKLLAKLADGPLDGVDVAAVVAKGLGLALSAAVLMLAELHRQKVIDRFADGKTWSRVWITPSGRAQLESLSRPTYDLAEEFDEMLLLPDLEPAEPPAVKKAAGVERVAATRSNGAAPRAKPVRVAATKGVLPAGLSGAVESNQEASAPAIEILRAQLAEAEARVARAASGEAEAAVKIADLGQRLADATRAAGSYESDLENLRQRHSRELDESRAREEALEAKVARMVEASETMGAENERLKSQLAQSLSLDEAERLKADTDELRRQLRRMAIKGAAAIKLVEELRAGESDAARYKDATEEQLEELEQLVLRLRAEVAALERRAVKAEGRSGRNREELSRVRRELRRVRASATRASNAGAEALAVRRESRTLSVRLAGAEKRVKAGAETIKALRSELRASRRATAQAVEASAAAQRQLAELESGLEVLVMPVVGSRVADVRPATAGLPRLGDAAIGLLGELADEGPIRDEGGEAADQAASVLDLEGGEVRKVLAALVRRGLVELDRDGAWIYGIWITNSGCELVRSWELAEIHRDRVVVELPVRRAV